jgi:uncharacterized protein (DUF4415 family)
VTDDHGQGAGVHEVDAAEIEHDAVVVPARHRQAPVELTAGHHVKVSACRHDQAVASAFRRELKSFQPRSPDISSSRR